MIPVEAYCLTDEQEFQLELLRRTVGNATRDVLEGRLLETFELLMRKENICKALIHKTAAGERYAGTR